MKPKSVSTYHWLLYNILFILEHLLGYKRFSKWFDGTIASLHKNLLERESSLDIDTDYLLRKDSFDTKDKYSLRPILYKGIAKDWSCVRQWNFDFFSSKYGDQIVSIQNTKGTIDVDQAQEYEELMLRDYIKQVLSGTLKYLKLSSLVQREEALQKDFPTAWLKQFVPLGSFGKTLYFFMGGKGSKTPIHNEIPNNLYVQVHGTKKWTLYPSNQRIFLHARTERRPYFFVKKEKDQKNLMLDLKGCEIVLHPGDVLFVPSFIWHEVDNTSNSIAFAFKFIYLPTSIRSSKLLTTLIFLSTKPFLLSTFIKSKLSKKGGFNNSDDYILGKN